MNLDALYPGRFVKGAALTGVTKIEILGVDRLISEEKGKPKKKEKPKAVITVRMRDPLTGEIGPHEIVWCKVNALLTKELYGAETDAWVGKLLFIRFDPTIRFGRDTPGGIRVCGAPASVLPTPRTVTIRIRRGEGGDFVEEHRLLPNGGLSTAKGGANGAEPAADGQ